MSKIFENTIWLSSEKLIRLGGGLILSVLTAKYLGPEQFGLFNFIVAFTAFFQIVTGLGYEATLVKYLIDHPEKKWKILSTSIWMRL
ncbi:MAG TPA: oligosaccharide flippase family protein, partial [Catalimonadaceae bacterium]|nr:oligosaccharide flippase family protein [Catalimonadaceae bacterium]